MPRPAKGGIKIGANVSETLYDFVQKEAIARGVDFSVIVIDALNFYKDHGSTPEQTQVIVEEILESKPELLDVPIMRALERNPKTLEKIASLIGAMSLNQQVSRKPKK